MSIASQINMINGELPQGVKLVAVSKFKPVSAVLEAYSAGQRAFGESRPKEMRDKALNSYPDIEWHFIGHLQTNKVKLVVPYVSMIESVDSVRLLSEIDRCSASLGRVTDCLLEVHIAREETKQGFSPDEIGVLMQNALQFPNIRFRGLMGMASNVSDTEAVRSEFRTLKKLFDSIERPSFDTLSMGMSHDWKIAVEEGATIVRIGTLIFGER